MQGKTDNMLNFDAERFLGIQKGAVALGPEIHAATQRYVLEGIDSVFFLGTGRAATLMYPAASFLASYSRLKVFTDRSAVLAAKSGFEVRGQTLAAKFKDEPYHIITGAGSAWPEAFYYGMCILEEMQWIRTRPVHASDFFHGTLELVEKGVSVILFKSED